MTVLYRANDAISHVADQEARQFRHIYLVSVAFFLVVAAIARLLPRSLRPWTSKGGARESVVAEARQAANRFIPFAFMGE